MIAASPRSFALALVALLFGAGAGALAFAKPALEVHSGLAQRQGALIAKSAALQARIDALESSLRGSAEKPLAYFDLRASQAPEQEMKTRSGETLAQLNTLFTRHKLTLDQVSQRALPAPAAGAGPLRLADQRFAFRLSGSYQNLVDALDGIGQLPPAIHLERYEMSRGLLGDDAPLTLTCELSVTYLLSDALPSRSQQLSATPSVPWFEALLGGRAEAAPAAPETKPSASAPAAPRAARAARPASHAAIRILDVRSEGEGLLVETSGGVPHARVVGGNRHLLIVEVENAAPTAAGRRFSIQHNGIQQVRAALYRSQPATTRLAIDTDGSVRLTPRLDAQGRLLIVGRPFAATADQALSERPSTRPAASVTPSRAVAHPASAPPASASAPLRARRSLATATAAPALQRDNPFQRLTLHPVGRLPADSPTKRYRLQAVVGAGSKAPSAVIRVQGVARQVKLGALLPDGARVTAIETDGVTLLLHRGNALRLTLAR